MRSAIRERAAVAWEFLKYCAVICAGGVVLLGLFGGLVSLSGCGTLRVQAEDYSHLDVRVLGPHQIRVTTDGEVVFEQRGAMALKLRAKKGTALLADEDCDDHGMCVLRRVLRRVLP